MYTIYTGPFYRPRILVLFRYIYLYNYIVYIHTYVCTSLFLLYLQLLQKSQAIAVKQKQICTLADGLKDQEVLLCNSTCSYLVSYSISLYIVEDSAKGAW